LRISQRETEKPQQNANNAKKKRLRQMGLKSYVTRPGGCGTGYQIYPELLNVAQRSGVGG